MQLDALHNTTRTQADGAEDYLYVSIKRSLLPVSTADFVESLPFRGPPHDREITK